MRDPGEPLIVTTSRTPRRVAVVGSGVSGLTAAYLLARHSHVTLFERDDRLGGHANTVEVADGDRTLSIDTGFIVLNDRTYPTLTRLFDELDVATQPTEMSMSVSCEGCGLEYAGARGPAGLFPTLSNVTNRDYLRMLGEVKRFHRHGRRLLEIDPRVDPSVDQLTIADMLAQGGYSDYFRDHFLLTLVGAVWSSSPETALRFPARYLVAFFANHGMLSVAGSPEWRTVVGGSQVYVRRIADHIQEVRTGAGAVAIARDATGVTLLESGGEEHRFDAVVIATHPDHAIKLLDDPTDDEREILGAFTYSRNEAVLHTDGSLLPEADGARASWNYRLDRCATDAPLVTVTYDLNRLQRLQTTRDHGVTLNQTDAIDPGRILKRMVYDHPIYDVSSLAAQRRLPDLNDGITAYAGAYHGWGFHEDGARAGLAAARSLGVDR